MADVTINYRININSDGIQYSNFNTAVYTQSTDFMVAEGVYMSNVNGTETVVKNCKSSSYVTIGNYYPNSDRLPYVGIFGVNTQYNKGTSNIPYTPPTFLPLAYIYYSKQMGGENAHDKLNLYILNENMCFEKKIIPVETENTQVVKTINLNNYHGDLVGFGQTGLLLNGIFSNVLYAGINYKVNDIIPLSTAYSSCTISSSAGTARLEINRGANGKSFQYDGGAENTSASYMLEIPTTGSHELTYNGVEPGLTELSVEVQNSEEIDVSYNDTWTSAPTTLTLTPSADTVTLRSNMQLTVTSENENIMDTITVNNEPQVTPYTGTITGTQNIVLKPTPPEITINYKGTSTPVISDT